MDAITDRLHRNRRRRDARAEVRFNNSLIAAPLDCEDTGPPWQHLQVCYEISKCMRNAAVAARIWRILRRMAEYDESARYLRQDPQTGLAANQNSPVTYSNPFGVA